MNNLIQTEAETEKVKSGTFFGSIEDPEMNEETSMPSKDQETIVSMIVLLLACAALAVLAHVFV